MREFFVFSQSKTELHSFMARNNSTQSHYWRNFFSRIALIVASVIIIVWFLPRNSGPQFRYDVGKPWMYSSLIANFDFPIYKTDEAIQNERDSILEAFEPYYNYNENIEDEQIASFRNAFKNGIPGLGPEYIEIIADRLHRLYQAGVMSTPEYSRIGKDTTSTVRVVSGKTASSVQINCIYSTIAAYEQLFQDEKLVLQRQALQRCNLNEYIRPNLIYDKERSETERNDLLSTIPRASGMVLAGQKIIDRGEIVDEQTFRELSSFEHEMRRRSASSSTISSTIAGQTLFVTILMSLFTIYLAQNLLGAPYASNANPPKNFDCAKFCYYCYGMAQASIKGSSYAQGYDDSFQKIAYDDLKRGDMVCFDTVSDDDLCDHTGIYLGGGYFIHASSAAKKVILSSLASGYYKRTFSWGRRIFEN